MHMNLWSYNKRKVGDTICTPHPPTLELGTVSKFKKESGVGGGGKLWMSSERVPVNLERRTQEASDEWIYW